MTNITFGPAGIGKVTDVEVSFEKYRGAGFGAAEIPFTYGVYIKDRETGERVGKTAEKFEIELSIHAPYWINLNSKEKEKVEASKIRILKSAEVGHWISLGSGSGKKTKIVFHCGFYLGSLSLESRAKPSCFPRYLGKKKGSLESKKVIYEEAYQNIKKQIFEMMEIVKEKKWNVVLCPEVMGKKNIFGSVEEISQLAKETGCGFCIDFAHVLARYGKYEFELVEKGFPQKEWHCHFSGIEYGDAGEKKHKLTSEEDWKNVLGGIPKDKMVTIICESPSPVEDSVMGLKLYNK